MSLEGSSGEPGFGPCGSPYGPPCDHERVFELADGGLEPEEAREVRRHVELCSPCRDLYEREVHLNSYLRSDDFSGGRMVSCSVHRGVAMALPTRSPVARLLWAALAGALLLLALAYLELNDTEPVMLAMSMLAACWGLVSGSADVVRAVLAAAGPTILLVLALGALADLLIALVFVSASRGRRRAREA